MYRLTSNDEELILFFNTGNKVHVIRPFEIIYIQAMDNYSNLVFVESGSYLICKHLKKIEQDFISLGFLRCHRSYLINPIHIEEIVAGKSQNLVMVNGDIIPVSRRKSTELYFLLRKNLNKAAYPLTFTAHSIKHTAP